MTEQKRTLDNLEIIGGAVCLNFTNTINSRRSPEHDYLMTYWDLAGWSHRVGLLTAEQMAHLQAQAEAEPIQARNALQKALTVRELLYRLFSRVAQQSEPREEDLKAFAPWLGEAIANGVIVKREDTYTLDWPLDQTFEAVLWPILHSAGELLLSHELRHVKECPGCGWLFLDSSKNQSRRWCSMNSCGVSDKMRRYYRKTQQGK